MPESLGLKPVSEIPSRSFDRGRVLVDIDQAPVAAGDLLRDALPPDKAGVLHPLLARNDDLISKRGDASGSGMQVVLPARKLDVSAYHCDVAEYHVQVAAPQSHRFVHISLGFI